MLQGPQSMKRLAPAILGLLLTPLSQAETVQGSEPVPQTVTETQTISVKDINKQLAQLIDQQQFQQAKELAEQHLDAFEGDSQFDFFYGFSAAQSGAHHEALFVFERLSDQFPQVPRYRLELARSYYFLGQLDASEAEFRQVLAQNPPNKVRATIDKFLRRIEEQRQALTPSWSALASYGGGYDSNINSSTDIDEIDLILEGTEQRVRLNDSQKETASGFYKLRGQASYSAPITKRSGFDIRIGGQRKANAKTDTYDLNSAFVQGGLQLIRGFHHWRVGGGYQQYWLSDESLQSTLSANLNWKYRMAPAWRFNSRAELRNNDNQINDDLDALQLEISAGPEYANGRFSAQSSAMISTDSADNSPLAKDIFGINLAAQYALSDESSAYSMLAWRNYEFQKKNPNDLLSNGKQRSETLTQFILGYNQQIIAHLMAYGQFSYMDNSSNIDVYQYDRLLLEAGLTLAF